MSRAIRKSWQPSEPRGRNRKMGKKEKIVDEYRKDLHNITVARTEEEIDELFGKTEELITGNSDLFTPKEYDDNLATLRIFTWKARAKIQEGI